MRFSVMCSVMCLAALAGGCAHKPQTFDPLPFDEAEYSALPKTGTGIVQGQVFAKTVGGDVKKGAGNKVVMFPATKYGQQRYTEQVIGGKLLSTKEDPRYVAYVKSTVTDGEGRYSFRDVPPGKYYLISHVTWQVPSSYGLTPQGGQVNAEVDVKDGQTANVMLTF